MGFRSLGVSGFGQLLRIPSKFKEYSLIKGFGNIWEPYNLNHLRPFKAPVEPSKKKPDPENPMPSLQNLHRALLERVKEALNHVGNPECRSHPLCCRYPESS